MCQQLPTHSPRFKTSPQHFISVHALRKLVFLLLDIKNWSVFILAAACVTVCLVDARAHLIWFVDSEKLARDDDVSKCHSPLARDVTLRASHASQLRALHTAHSCADVIAPPVLFLAVIYGLLRRSLVYLRFISSQLPSLVSESLTV